MKNIINSLIITTFVVAGSTSAAESNTMTFKGNIKIPATCSIPSDTLTFNMGANNSDLFSSTTTGPITTVVSITQALAVTCNGVIPVSLTLQGNKYLGTPAPDYVFAIDYNQPNPALGVGLMFKINGAIINNGGTINLPDGSSTVAITTSYYQTEYPVFAGTVSASVTLSINYN